VAVLQPAHVDADRDQQDEAEDERIGAAGDSQPHEPIDDDHDDNGAEHRLGRGAAPAAKAVPAQDRRGQHGDLQTDSRV
jgi:hypothetical protein